jgi:FtsP/CotA-like multicopper oxidase with cupredoxin domain
VIKNRQAAMRENDKPALLTRRQIHAFQVMALSGAPLAGAVRDTVLVPPMGSVTIAFDADNPGRWAFHCHTLYHMMSGMMTAVRYPAIL